MTDMKDELKMDEFGLLEGDELLRSEVISAKLDLILANQAGILNLISSLAGNGQARVKHLRDSLQCTSDGMKKYKATVEHLLQQYIERKKKCTEE